MTENLLTHHLGSLMMSFSPLRRLSVVMDKISNTTPAPLLASLCALSGWSPEIGTISIGTAWQIPSKRPCEPAWVMKARAPGCANTGCQMLFYVTYQRSVLDRSGYVATYRPSKSFWGTHFIIFTFSGTPPVMDPVYLHITYKEKCYLLRFDNWCMIWNAFLYMVLYLLWNLPEGF